jgi:hypothetical protein
MRPNANRSPSTASIGLLGCLAGLLIWSLVLAVAVIAGQPGWAWIGAFGVIACLAGGCACGARVRARGFYHRPPGGDDDAGRGDGGSPVDPPGRGPHGDGGVQIDWDAFETEFWRHVAELDRHRAPPAGR